MKKLLFSVFVVGSITAALLTYEAHSAQPLSAVKASAVPVCRGEPWRGTRELAPKVAAAAFKRLHHRVLIEHLVSEVTDPKPDLFAFRLLTYLHRTEQNVHWKGFLELVRESADLGREQPPGRKVPLDEICGYFRNAAELAAPARHD